MSGGVGLPAPKGLLKNFSVEDVDEDVKSSEFAQLSHCTCLKAMTPSIMSTPSGSSNNRH